GTATPQIAPGRGPPLLPPLAPKFPRKPPASPSPNRGGVDDPQPPLPPPQAPPPAVSPNPQLQEPPRPPPNAEKIVHVKWALQALKTADSNFAAGLSGKELRGRVCHKIGGKFSFSEKTGPRAPKTLALNYFSHLSPFFLL